MFYNREVDNFEIEDTTTCSISYSVLTACIHHGLQSKTRYTLAHIQLLTPDNYHQLLLTNNSGPS